MTEKEFYEKYCKHCGTQRCPADAEAISTCGYYKGDIEGIEKIETRISYAELKRVMEESRKQTEKFKELAGYKDFVKFIERMGLK